MLGPSKMVKVVATLVKGKDLQPGDLFSAVGPWHWSGVELVADPAALGERVFIRTNSPCPVEQEEEPIYRITVESC